MTTTPTGGSRPPLLPLRPNVSARLASPGASMTDGVLSTPVKARTSQQRTDFPGASLQNRHTISPVELARTFDLSSAPTDKPNTPLTERSKAKTDSSPELQGLVTRLNFEGDDAQNSEQILREKMGAPSNKRLGASGREAVAKMDATLEDAKAMQVTLAPSDIYCVPIQSGSESVAISLSKLAGGDSPVNSLSTLDLENKTDKKDKTNKTNKTANSDRALLKDCLGELFGDFDVSGDLSINQFWDYLRGAREPSGANPQEVFHDKRNFLITVVRFKDEDNSQLKFFSVSGLPPVEEGATEASYTMLGACDPNKPSVVRVPLLPNAPEAGQVAIEANYKHLEPVPNAKFIHLSYADISTKIDGVDHEMREVPRAILTRKVKEKSGNKITFQALDRARDTEFVVLNALAAIKKVYPGKFAKGFDITMFSKLKMCASCHWAATYSRTSRLFGNHGDFRIYGADELLPGQFEKIRQKLDANN